MPEVSRLNWSQAGTMALALSVMSVFPVQVQARQAPANTPEAVQLLRPETPLYTATLAARLAAASNDPQLGAAAVVRAAGATNASASMRTRAILSSMEAGDFPGAARLAEAIPGQSRGSRALVALASQSWIDRNYRQVLSVLAGQQLTGPENLVAQTMVGWSRFLTGDRNGAVASMAAGTGARVGDIANLATRALMLDAAGKRREALAAYQGLWELGLRNDTVTRRYVIALLQEGKQTTAEEVLAEALPQAFDQAGFAALRDRGVPRNARLTPAEARSASITVMAVALLSESEVAWPSELAIRSGGQQDYLRLLLGANQLEKDNQSAAVATLRGIDPGSLHYPTAAVLIIQSLLEIDPAAAIVEVEAGLARRPNDPQLLIAAGFADTKAKRYAQAIARYDRLLAGTAAGTIVASTEDRASAHMFRATLLDYDNQLDRAEADYRAAYALTPGNASVLNGLGYFLANRSRNLPEAALLLQRAVNLEPRSGAIVDSLGWAYYRQGRFEQAVGLLERAISLEPRSAEIADHLGDAYWRTGREIEARMEWRKAIGLIQPGELGQPDQAALEAKIRDGMQPLPPAPERTEKTDS